MKKYLSVFQEKTNDEWMEYWSHQRKPWFKVGLQFHFKNAPEKTYTIVRINYNNCLCHNSSNNKIETFKNKFSRMFRSNDAIIDGYLTDEEAKKLAGYDKPVPLTRSNISKFIQFSTSKYNPYKKERVVDEAYEILKNGKDIMIYPTGSYTEGGAMGGYDYLIDGPNKRILKGLGDSSMKAMETIYDEIYFK